jgi:hypothetical protein
MSIVRCAKCGFLNRDAGDRCRGCGKPFAKYPPNTEEFLRFGTVVGSGKKSDEAEGDKS